MSRSRVRKTALAKADIEEIAHWIAESSGSMEVALRWWDQLDEKFQSIADAPGTGTAHPHLGRTVRSSPFGKYLVFFRRSRGKSITIVRVIYGGRDLSSGLAIE